MGFASHSVENLGPPFLLVDETVFVVPKASEVALRKHHFKILLVLGGEVEHEIDGIEGRHPLAPGDILVAPMVQRHSYVNPSRRDAASVHVIRLFFDAAHLQRHTAKRPLRPEVDFSDFLLHHFNRVAHLRGAIDSHITALIEQLRTETEQRSPGYRHRVRAICTELVVATARRMERGRTSGAMAAGSNASQIVASAKEYILKHFATDLTLADIAWHVRKGEEHLARVFKRHTGQSVFDYVRQLRVNHAKTLLQDAGLTLTEIAERCGFHSVSFFSRTFRTHVGIPPSRYRGQVAPTSQPAPGRQRLVGGR